MTYWIVYLPKKLEREAPFTVSARLRIEGSIGGHPVALALLPKRGRRYLLINRALGRKIGAGVGSRVAVAFELTSESAVNVPPELAEALRQEPAWASAWDRLTPGAKRGICHRVGTAKRSETRAKRAVEVLRELPLLDSDGAFDADDAGVTFVEPDLAGEDAASS